jgi:hypothetical protein
MDRYAVYDLQTGKRLVTEEHTAIVVYAFTAKNAKHQVKQRFGDGYEVRISERSEHKITAPSTGAHIELSK